jgi:hypothetical protein
VPLAAMTRPWRWLLSSACAPSSPTTTSASASCTGARAIKQEPRSTSRLRPRCTARWAWASGCRRRRRNWRRSTHADDDEYAALTAGVYQKVVAAARVAGYAPRYVKESIS